jgi:hypothetical protein
MRPRSLALWLVSLAAPAGAQICPPSFDPSATTMLERHAQHDADGVVAGRVVSVSGGELVLEPYDREADLAHFAFERERVFTSSRVVDAALVDAGSDVEVYYQKAPDAPPRTVGVEILTPDRARRVEARVNGWPPPTLR